MMSYFATECKERSQSIEGPCDDFFKDWVYPVGHSMALGSMKVSMNYPHLDDAIHGTSVFNLGMHIH